MREPDVQKLDALVGRLVGDLGAAVSGVLVTLGDHLGLFKAHGGWNADDLGGIGRQDRR